MSIISNGIIIDNVCVKLVAYYYYYYYDVMCNDSINNV